MYRPYSPLNSFDSFVTLSLLVCKTCLERKRRMIRFAFSEKNAHVRFPVTTSLTCEYSRLSALRSADKRLYSCIRRLRLASLQKKKSQTRPKKMLSAFSIFHCVNSKENCMSSTFKIAKKSHLSFLSDDNAVLEDSISLL